VSARHFYDALGSALFAAIGELPWYRITRAEIGLLVRHGREILRAAGPIRAVVELGAGNGAKLAALLDAGAARTTSLTLHLIDVSPAALASAERTLTGRPGVSVVAHETDYGTGLRTFGAADRAGGAALAVFLGSNIGNFDPPDADRLLAAIRSALSPGDTLLLGTDLVKPESELRLAYDDPLGVTAAFNLNVFLRMNRELGATFDLCALRHQAIWNAGASRVEMHAECTRAHRVRIPAADLDFELAAGERIWTESSYKYRADQVPAMLARVGFRAVGQWIDPDAAFALTLAERVSAAPDASKTGRPS
jgi:dimethylhistidine N-methyltransferase